MKVRNMLVETLKEAPADCSIESQKIMIRGGYIKYMHSGVYSSFMLTKRIARKIEEIIRQEMDAIEGQEVQFPVVMPASLWEESGRYQAISKELARLQDRNGNEMVLGMTHEEAAVHMARNVAKSYVQYPFMIYQIQTKFRDEMRPRGGLIRVREFTMKDAYSFHTTQEDLEKYYERAFVAYERIFRRAGVKKQVAVKSDSGMMGGKIAHEFMLLSDIGEDTLAICTACDYKANLEAATVTVHNQEGSVQAFEKIHTPGVTTIEELCDFLGIQSKEFCKAVVYQKNADDAYVIAFIRGDHEVNETKLRNLIGAEIHPALVTEESGIVAGFIGPIGLPKDVQIVFDATLKGIESLICGANEIDYHCKGLNLTRDIGKVSYADVATIQDGSICPSCGQETITIEKGIEIGNIFQLGQKYTQSMEMTYTDQQGDLQYPIMGCYGIGVGRLIASICEECHDEYGPIWPISIAPWQVQMCSIRSDDAGVAEVGEALYHDLQKEGIEVLWDDRDLRPGAMFADADLFGIPIRIVVSPKNLAQNVLEISYRDKTYKGTIALENAVAEIKAHVDVLLDKITIFS